MLCVLPSPAPLCANSELSIEMVPSGTAAPSVLTRKYQLTWTLWFHRGEGAEVPRPIKQLYADAEIVAELRRRSRSTTIGGRDRERAEIILRRLDGVGAEAVAEQLNTTPKRVSLWCVRFEASGLDGLADKPGRGRKASIPAANVARVVTEATRPPAGRRRWSIRSMGRHAGIS